MLQKLLRALLRPPAVLLCLLTPLSAAALVYTMRHLEETAPLRLVSYVLSAYTLAALCLRLPSLCRGIRRLRRENPHLRRWQEDIHLRAKVTLTGQVLWNGGYAALQLGLGLYHHAAWFYSLAVYYLSLALMRFFLLRHSLRYRPGQERRGELRRCRLCGWLFLLMNLALSGMMLFMLREDRLPHHHEITTIAMAAYTFTSLTMAIINLHRYRRYNSPLLSASRAISLAAACVSMLTLERSMLTTFDTGQLTQQGQTLLMALSGAAVSACIIFMAVYLLIRARSTQEEPHGN